MRHDEKEFFSTGAISYTSSGPQAVNSAGEVDIPLPPVYPSYSYLGIYHTHPFNPGDPTMTEAESHFSPEGIGYATTNAPMYVGVIDTLGDEPASDASGRWYQYNNVTQKETLENSLGAGGC